MLAEIEKGDEQVKADAIRIGNYTDGQFPTDSREFAKRIFYTVFMGSENRWVCSRVKTYEDNTFNLHFGGCAICVMWIQCYILATNGTL